MLALVGYEMIIANSVLSASLAGIIVNYSYIKNESDYRKITIYSEKVSCGPISSS